MSLFDTPITTDDNNLKKVLSQKLPVALYLFDSRQGRDKPLEDALEKLARKYAGQLLIARVDVAENPKVHGQYGNPQTPAIVTLVNGFWGRKVKSSAEAIRPADVRAHIDYLLDLGPPPEERKPAERKATSASRSATVEVTDATFAKEVLKSKRPVLVDFWAGWCAPCLALAPHIEQLASEYAGRVKVAKVDVDRNPMLAQRFQIRAIPTLMMFKNGQPIERRSGASPQLIREMIEEALLE